MKPTRPSIAVIGAGVAGLSAARTLSDAGFAVTVFDKGRGPGGRTSTRREGDYRFDHGAPYFTVRERPFEDAVSAWERDGVVTRWNPRVYGSDRAGSLVVGVPGMSAVCAALAFRVTVIARVGVTGARFGGGRWHLQGEYAAELGTFDSLVVAVPPRQAMPLLAQVHPLVRRIGHVPMTPCWAVMAAFDGRVDVDWDVGSFPGEPVSLAVRNSAKPGRPDSEAWVLHASPEWAASHLESDPEAVVKAMLHGLAERSPLPQTTFAAAHRWRYAGTDEPLKEGYLWDARSRAGVCADWCRGGGVEGAWLSGLELAQHVAEIG